jgi:hypothetical protein
VKTESNLAESSTEGYGSIGAVLPMMLLTAPFSPLHFGRHFIAVVFINADYDYSLAVVITGTF